MCARDVSCSIHSHIILMLADDMACNARNPRPGMRFFVKNNDRDHSLRLSHPLISTVSWLVRTYCLSRAQAVAFFVISFVRGWRLSWYLCAIFCTTASHYSNISYPPPPPPPAPIYPTGWRDCAFMMCIFYSSCAAFYMCKSETWFLFFLSLSLAFQ